MSVGKMVLSPTRNYAPVMTRVLKECRGAVKGLIHCTGGAQTKVLNFVDNMHIIKDNMFDTPLLFRMIQQQSQTDWEEMYSVFNMGHRMEIYADPAGADEILSIARSFGVDAQIIGRVEPMEGAKVTILKDGNQYVYTKQNH
jgi:phosphoribosylformylglycinamidine cyclo-ligase